MSTKYYISNIEYDENTLELEIEWTIDVVWKFFDVPKDRYLDLCNAEDKEEYYRNNIMEKFKGRQKWRDLNELLSITSDILLIDDMSQGVNAANCSNETAMYLAASWGDIKAIELLASNGADIDLPGDLGCTPLYYAVSNGHVDAVNLLLKLGAKPNSKNELNFTPYQLAVRDGDLKIKSAFAKYV